MISIIVAKSRNNVIGYKNKIPWHISEDLIRFKQITNNHPIIMGRRTYESILSNKKKDNSRIPLKFRTNIILTNGVDQITEMEKNLYFVPSKEKAIEVASYSYGNDEIFVIGGESVYKEFINITSKFYITNILADVEGDAFFPNVNFDTMKLLSCEKRKLSINDFKLEWEYLLYEIY